MRIRTAAGLLAISLLSGIAVGPQDSGVVQGTLSDESGVPVERGLVMIVGQSLGAMTDQEGWFRVEGVPGGEHLIVARHLGYLDDIGFVRVEAGEATTFDMQLPFDGRQLDGIDLPYPDSALRSLATTLFAQLFSQPDVVGYIREHWHALPHSNASDTLPVWAEWSSRPDHLIEGVRPSLRIKTDCEGCDEVTLPTLEGGLQYVAAIPHIRLGVRVPDAGTRRVEFFVGFIEPGQRLLRGSGRPPGALLVRFVEHGPETWVRVRLDWDGNL